METNFRPGESVVIIQTFKTMAFVNGKSFNKKIKLQAGRKGTFTRVVNVPQFFRKPAHDVYMFILPYGATRYEVHLSLDEAQKFLAAETQSFGQPVMQSQQSPHVVQAPQASRVDELVKLAALKERGLLNDEEFANEKSRILNQTDHAQYALSQTDVIKNNSSTASDTLHGSHDESSANPNNSDGNYYLWIVSMPTWYLKGQLDELTDILGYPKWADGIKPKHQPEIRSQREQLIDLMSLTNIQKHGPVRLNKLLNGNDAEDMVSRLRQIAVVAEIRPS